MTAHNLPCPHGALKRDAEGGWKHYSHPDMGLLGPAYFLETITCYLCNALSAFSTRLAIISGADKSGMHGA